MEPHTFFYSRLTKTRPKAGDLGKIQGKHSFYGFAKIVNRHEYNSKDFVILLGFLDNENTDTLTIDDFGRIKAKKMCIENKKGSTISEYETWKKAWMRILSICRGRKIRQKSF